MIRKLFGIVALIAIIGFVKVAVIDIQEKWDTDKAMERLEKIVDKEHLKKLIDEVYND